MKKIVVAIMVLAMMLSAMAAMAQSEKTFSITPRLVADFALDKDTKDYVGSQYGLLIDLDFATFPIGFQTGFLGGSKSGNDVTLGDDTLSVNIDQKVTTWSVPLLLTYKYPFSEQFYGNIALGANIQHDNLRWEYTVDNQKYDEDDAKTSTKFAFKLGFGYKFSQNWSVELNYANYGKINHDIDFASGIPQALGIDSMEYKQNYLQLNVGYTF